MKNIVIIIICLFVFGCKNNSLSNDKIVGVWKSKKGAIVEFSENKSVKIGGGFFFGKTVVLTGTLGSMSRDEAKDIIRSQGGNIACAVS